MDLIGERIVLERWHRLQKDDPNITVSEAADRLAGCVAPGYALRYAKQHRLVRGDARNTDLLVLAGQRAAAKAMILGEECARAHHPSTVDVPPTAAS